MKGARERHKLVAVMVIVVAFIRSSGHIMHASTNSDWLHSAAEKETKISRSHVYISEPVFPLCQGLKF